MLRMTWPYEGTLLASGIGVVAGSLSRWGGDVAHDSRWWE